jgi:hypothetical protein
MNTLDELVSEAIDDFRKVAALAYTEFSTESLTVEISPKPHKSPRSLPTGQYTSQHYNPGSAMSTLAQSILTNPTKVGAVNIDPLSAGDWIRKHTDRVNLLLPATFGIPLLSLLEAFLHVRWKPVFEGRSEGI